ncbi:endocuticle structural glycoprotein SgAbd-5 [Scaptodrosophila lebanonensis]|uniref:Endocuticle structural glycoprotein SgAbd-5 n=1 Tax=Drosophila lebanonensis TaxID=7225 RepID=A0A6J2UG42_DROLE|nr:endocuticle structural glycoprotein SgAbd-5 [Scaptodrosophila lebanonensis]
MQRLILFLALFITASFAVPAPQSDDSKAETTRLESENNGVDKYSFAYETSNGISRSEEGELKGGGAEGEGNISVQGTTSWTAPDGKKYELSFTADETGYHPTFKLVA